MKDIFLLRKYIAALLLGESGVNTFDAVKFWSARKMITESLQKKFSGHRGFEADPFLNSQEEVPGFVLKEVKIEGDQAQVTIRVNLSRLAMPPIT